jgi:hypothetical protein
MADDLSGAMPEHAKPDFSEIDTMSVKELRALRDRVDNVIRAQIARMRVEAQSKVTPGGRPAETIDLEREVELWKARRG